MAMSYSVYAAAASAFMDGFYTKLAQNASLAEATAAGRRTMVMNPHRTSVAGAVALQDWVVPTLYQQPGELRPFPSEVAIQVPAPGVAKSDECPTGETGCIGRDYDMLAIPLTSAC
jgi:hypothetical protein